MKSTIIDNVIPFFRLHLNSVESKYVLLTRKISLLLLYPSPTHLRVITVPFFFFKFSLLKQVPFVWTQTIDRD